MRKDKTDTRAGGAGAFALRIAAGFIVGVGLFFGLTAAFAAAGLKWDIDETKYRYFVWGALVVSAFCGGFLAVLPVRKNGFAIGGAAGAAGCIPIMIAVCAASDKSAGGKELLAALAFVIACCLGGVAAANRKIKRKYK